MPYKLVEEDPELQYSPDKWGPKVKIGVEGKEGDFFLIKAADSNSQQGFWQLPADLQARAEADKQTVNTLIEEALRPPKLYVTGPNRKRKRAAAPASAEEAGTSSRVESKSKKHQNKRVNSKSVPTVATEQSDSESNSDASE